MTLVDFCEKRQDPPVLWRVHEGGDCFLYDPGSQVETTRGRFIDEQQYQALTSFKERSEYVSKELKATESFFHHTRGVYSNGEYKDNGVLAENLGAHIQYNMVFRPGRAFFLDGKCLYPGSLGWTRCEELEKSMTWPKATKDTALYV